MSWDTLRAAIESLVYRGKVVSAAIKGRTLLQVTGYANDAYNNIELLLPPGYVAMPTTGSDVVLMQVGAYGSHKFCLGGDHTADAISNLQPGETGLSRGGQQILLRIGRAEIISPLLQWGTSEAGLKRLVQEAFVELFNGHTHPDPQGGNTGAPNQQMNASHLTGGS